MKNIHVLPTENSSRLSYNKDGVLELHRLQWRKNTQNIYITSDEEIKEGDWFIYKNEIIHRDKGKIDSMWVDAVKNGKKIILTTDQNLIKNGVQAIDDEFLEWFVKNPSCEWVKILRCPIEGLYTIDLRKLIPKKEPKQTVQEYEQQGLEKHSFELEPKQETLEEATKKWIKGWGGLSSPKQSFIQGAKWQQEQENKKYSEEEVVSFIHKFLKEHQPQLPYLLGGINMWFGQYKKK